MSLIQKIKNYIMGASEKQQKNVAYDYGISLTKRFYKENGLWYIDLPEFIEGGYGSKNNLLMVDGSDKLLDILSNNTNEVTIQFGDARPYEDYDVEMQIADEGLNQDILSAVGHAPISYGRYYEYQFMHGSLEEKVKRHRAWLCPVAEWVFGCYPKIIYVKVIK